jgi:fatty-acyl-CoA synthase
VKPDSLLGRISARAKQRPGEPALTFVDAQLRPHTYSRGELLAIAEDIADRITEAGLARRAPLGILLGSQAEQVVHYLGALLAGVVPAVLTPPNRKLNRTYYAETMAAVLERSGFSAVVTDLDVGPQPTLAPRTLELSGTRPSPAEGPPVAPDVSFMQFSSGTTGIKRGVLVSDRAVLEQLDTYAAALDLSEDDVIVSWLPLYHDMGFIAALNMPLAFGVHVVMIDPIDWVTNPGLFVRAASEHRGTLSWNPNFAYAFMGQRVANRHLDGLDLSSLRGLVNCSEPVTLEAQQFFVERFAPFGLREDVFRGCYAMAETVFALTDGTPEDPGHLDTEGPRGGPHREGSRVHVSVGSPLEGVDLRVVGADGSELPDREIGELRVRSPFNLDGYYRNPEATREAFVDGWYRTGDLGYRVGDAFYVVGRSKDIFIVSGVNVFPQDIEDLVGAIEGMRPGRVSVFAEFDPRQQTERVVILAESPLEGEAAKIALLDVRQRVQASFLISGFDVHLVPPEWLVKSSSGKMARGANRRKWLRQRDGAELRA